MPRRRRTRRRTTNERRIIPRSKLSSRLQKALRVRMVSWRGVAGAVLCLLVATTLCGDNVIQRENAKPGSPDWVPRNEAENHEIEGYASATSVNRGESISLFVNTTSPTYTI